MNSLRTGSLEETIVFWIDSVYLFVHNTQYNQKKIKILKSEKWLYWQYQLSLNSEFKTFINDRLSYYAILMIISSSKSLKVVVRPKYVLHYAHGANKVGNTTTHNFILEIIDSACNRVTFLGSYIIHRRANFEEGGKQLGIALFENFSLKKGADPISY